MMVEDLPMPLDRRSFVRRGVLSGITALGVLGRADGAAVRAREAGRPARVLIWCEGTARRSVYPRDIDGALAEYLGRRSDLSVSRGRLGDPDAGLGDETLDRADVL